ncbi:hypothetical protein AB0J72_53435 [Dactylosporangium sp. NPDC049742]|uniref:hypothetical protein n=1 Tax=Dactylosporangium sp. NPDC049742 TaxID=3154737 RepID=UPI00341590BC
MSIRKAVTTAVAVAATAAGLVLTAGAPSSAASGYNPPRQCSLYDQSGYKGDVCVTYYGFGDGVFVADAHAERYPAGCARFRVDLIDTYGTRTWTSGDVPCVTGTVGSARYPAIVFVKERAQARVTSYDSTGAVLLSVTTDVLASPYAPRL